MLLQPQEPATASSAHPAPAATASDSALLPPPPPLDVDMAHDPLQFLDDLPLDSPADPATWALTLDAAHVPMGDEAELSPSAVDFADPAPETSGWGLASDAVGTSASVGAGAGAGVAAGARAARRGVKRERDADPDTRSKSTPRRGRQSKTQRRGSLLLLVRLAAPQRRSCLSCCMPLTCVVAAAAAFTRRV